jgi:hypothetical protein
MLLRHWLSRLQNWARSASRSGKVSRRQSRQVGHSFEALEQRTMLAAATVARFTGADPGEGLDLDGNFAYAVDFGGQIAVTTQVRDARFVSDSVTGVTINAPFMLRGYVAPFYGNGINDAGLAEVMSSIRHGAPNGNMTINLAGVSPGATYKLQLLFADTSTVRGFDVKVEGALIRDDFSPSGTQGTGQQNSAGAVLTYEFVAQDDTVNIELNGSTTSFLDKNSIINALTLEDLRPKVTLSNPVSMTEGFGYGSTIAGLGGAIDTTTAGTFPFGYLGNPTGIPETGQFTMESWLYPKPGVPNGVIWNYSEGYQLLRVNDTGLRLILNRTGVITPGADIDVTIDNALEPDAWNHMAVTFDSDALRLFVNGVELATIPETVPDYVDVTLVPIVQLQFTSSLVPGVTQTGAGMIDEMRLWNVARSQAEIQEASLQQLVGNEAGLVGYWTFDNPSSIDPTNGLPYTELDSSLIGNKLEISPRLRRENAAPQIGYVDVLLDRPVTSPQGLFVTYSLSTNSAVANSDFFNSRFRVVSNNPSTEKNGIIIPQGESSGRIYFFARSDAIFEPTESITVAVTPFSLTGAVGGSDYLIGAGSSATSTVSITDNGAFKPGVSITDATGRAVTATSPLYINPSTGSALISVRLTSQPTAPVIISFPKPDGSSTSVQFTPSTWDQPVTFTISRTGSSGTITVEDLRFNGTYFGAALSFPFTTTAPSAAYVQEGNPNDLTPVKPTVNLATISSVNEDADAPAVVRILLNTPAPAGGLDVFYSLLPGGTARQGTNFQPLPAFVHIDAGLQQADIPIYPIDDQVDQGASVGLTILLSSNANYVVGSQSQAAVSIYNDDRASIVVANPSFIDVQVPKDQAGISITQTTTSYSSTYSPLVTSEPLPKTTATTEPNNSLATAYPLDTVFDGTTVSSQLIDGPGDVDLYRFKLDATQGRPDTLQVNFQFDATHNLRLDLLNAATGTILQTAPLTGQNQYLDLTTLADGEYVARVRTNDASVVSTSYTLKFRTLKNLAEPEGNDSQGTATYLGVAKDGDRFSDFAIGSPGDQDFYRFTLNTAAGRPSLLNLLTTIDDGNITLSLPNDGRSATLATPFNGQAVKQIALFGLPDGDYILRVGAIAGGVLNKYDLTFGPLVSRQKDIDPNQVALRLDTKPLTNVTLNLSHNGPLEGRLSITTLTFTPSNWDQYQFVTVIPLDDNVADGDATYTVTAVASSSDPAYQNRTLKFQITNVDRGNFVPPAVVNVSQDLSAPLVSIGSLPPSASGEGQTIDGFRVELTQPLPYDLTVGLEFDRGTAVYGQDFTVDTGSTNPNEVTIPAGALFKIIRVTLINDLVDESATNINETLRATIVDRPTYRVADVVDPGFSAKLEIFDNNVAGFRVLGPGGFAQNRIASTDERSYVGAAQHSIQLETKPTANVTVFVASNDTSEGLIQLDPTKPGSPQIALVFTPDNWNVSQTFYLRGVDDSIDDGNVRYKFVVSSTSDDDVYRQLAPQSFDVVNADDDTLGITVTPPQTTVSGRANVFSVVLNTQPLGEINVTLTPQNGQIFLNTARAGDPLTLTFNASNWRIPQLVQAGALDDGIVENFHTSQVNFTVTAGRQLNGPSVADISDPSRAFDLADISGGVYWKNLSLPLKPGATQSYDDGVNWISLDFANKPDLLTKLRLLPAGDNNSDLPDISLYRADGQTFVSQGVRTPAAYDAKGFLVAPASTSLAFNQVPTAGTYLLKISGTNQTGINTKFDLVIDDADRGFESVALKPVPISIQDNDLPTAEILTGPTASEIFSQPSYFAVRLNAPAPANLNDTGVKVYFQVTGGRATLGSASSTLHDYTVSADQFDPSTGIGWVRVSPGDVQANIGIIPVDDKLVEDLQVSLSQFNSGSGQILISVKRELIDSSIPYDPTFSLLAGTVIQALLPTGQEVQLTVKSTATLQLNAGQTEYAATVGVDLSTRDAVLTAAIPTGTLFTGAAKSEDVEITLLSGAGYILPLAPDKQAANPNVAANLDRSRIVADLKIFDDDVPGVQVIEEGDHTSIAEGDTKSFQISLTSEPLQPVTVTLTPSGQMVLVNPAAAGTGLMNVTSYTMGTQGIPSGLDLTFVSLSETDQGYSAVFDSRLTRVSYGSASRTSTLRLTGANSGGTDAASYEIPSTSDVDAAGNPEHGTWDITQRVTVTQLKQNSDGTFSLSLNLDGTTTTITLTPSTTTKSVTTTTLTFNPSNWFVPQTVTISALTNAFAEPGEWHKNVITYRTASSDLNWNNLAVPAQEVHVLDAQLDVGDTLAGLTDGFNMLQDGLLGLEIPLLATVGDLPVLNGLFAQFEEPLTSALADQEDVSVSKFQLLAESALQPLITAGVLDHVSIVPTADESEVRIDLHLDKRILLGQIDLSADLGLDALGIRFNTTGRATAVIDFSFDLAFGWSQQFGFFIDTSTTGMHLGARLSLEGNGATADNPNNLFTGQGSLGFLQLDFTDDPNNSTELGITFDVALNDLDNVNTIQFFDVNGDGLLGEVPFTYQVGTDANNDGRIDKNASGDPILRTAIVAEPWTNFGANGKGDDFPTVTQIAGTTIAAASEANWNKVGTNTNTFDEASSIRNEGIYRTKTQGNVTIVYLDLNRDGKLNIARRNADPFTTDWTSLSAAEKNSSEIWYRTTTPNSVPDLKVLTTGSGASLQYYVDANRNNIAETNESISSSLRAKLDKDKSGFLEGDVIQDGEGTFIQGTSTAFYDANGNQKLDFNEPFISYGFESFELSTELFVEDSSGNKFLDLNGDGIFNGAELRLRSVPGTDTVYLDLDNDGFQDPEEFPISKSAETFTIPQSLMSGSSLITLGTVVYAVRTVDGTRYIDLDGNGELNRNDAGEPLEPVASQRTELEFDDLARLVVKIDASNSSVFSSVSADVQKLRLGQTLDSAGQDRVAKRFDELRASGQVIEQANDGDRLTLPELVAFRQSITSNNATASDQIKATVGDLFTYQFQGDVNLGLTTRTSVSGSTEFPSFQFDLAINIPLFNFGNAEEANDDGMSVQFNNVAMDLGSFLSRYMEPILAAANQVLGPIKPLIAALNADTKILGFLGLAGAFESDGKPGVSLLEIAKKLSGSSTQAAKIDKAIQFANQLTKLSDMVDLLSESLSGDQFLLQFGSFSLNDLRGASDDLANQASRASNAPRTDSAPRTTATIPATTAASIDQQAQQSSKFKNAFNSLKQLDGLSFQLFNPDAIFALLTGEDNVRLVTYDIPDIDFAFDLSRTFRIWGPIAGKLEGGFNVKTDFSFGYDTHGFQEWANNDFAIDKSYLAFDGLFLDDWNAAGADKDELSVRAYIGAGLGLDVGIANGFVKGGVEGTIGLDFVDVGERSGTSDGRIRGSDIIEKLSTNPADLIDLNGRIAAYLAAEVNVNFFFFKAKVYDKRLATIQLAKFQLSAGGSSGSSHTGRIQTGTTAGATVWLDVNNNGQFDPDEPFTISDFEGKYDLIVPDEIDFSAAPIRIEGGIDVSTGLEATDDVTIPAGQGGNATAFTSLEEALGQLTFDTSVIDFNGDLRVDADDQLLYLALRTSDPQNPWLDINRDTVIDSADSQLFAILYAAALNGGRLSVAQSQTLIEEQFGIDPSISLATFLHYDEAMAGNPLARPVIVGENNLNSLVTQIDAVLAGASGVARNNHDLSGIFSEATFQAVARQLIQGSLDLTDRDQLRAILLDAMQHADETIANQGLHFSLNTEQIEANLDAIVEILHSTMVNQQTLATSTPNSADLAQIITASKVLINGHIAQDLHDLAVGLFTADQIAEDARTDAALLDRVLHTPLPPQVSMIPDVVLEEDGDPYKISFTANHRSFDAGTVSISVFSDDLDLLPAGAFSVTAGANPGEFLLKISPAPNGHGMSNVTIRAIDSTGSSTDETFTVTVTSVDDAPMANDDSSSVVAGEAVTVAPLANDSDPEGDALLLGLVSVPATGQVFINPDQTVTYTPDLTTRGPQQIVYQVDDSNGGISTATITFNVTPANTAPTAAALTNMTSSLPEYTDTLSDVKVANITYVDDGLGTNVLSLTGPDAEFFHIVGNELFLKAGTILDFEPKSTYSVTVTVDDASIGSSPDTSVIYTLTVLDVKESAPPVIGAFGSPISYLENAAPISLGSSTTVTDPDTTNFRGGRLTVSLIANGSPDDRLAIRNQGLGAWQIAVSGNQVISSALVNGVVVSPVIGTFTGGTSGSDPLVITFNSNVFARDVLTVIRSLTFSTESENPSTLPRTVRLQLTDGGGGSATPVTKTINVNAVNDAPVLGNLTSGLAYVKDLDSILIAANTTFSDVDSPDLDQGKLVARIAAYVSGDDRISIRNQGTAPGQIGVNGSVVTFGGVAIGTFSGTTALTVLLNANATPEAVQMLVRNLTFSNISRAVNNLSRTISATVSDGDGGTSLAVTTTISVTGSNDDPVIAAFDGSVAYTENAAPIGIDSDATVADVDLVNFDGGILTVDLTANGNQNDRLAIRNQGLGAWQIGISGNQVISSALVNGVLVSPVVGTFTGGTSGSDPLVITFNSNAFARDVLSVIRSLTFSTETEDPSTLSRTVRLQLTDGDGGSAIPTTKTINVISVNDAPTINGFEGNVTYSAAGSAVQVSSNAVIDDVDTAYFNSGTLKVSLTTNQQATDLLEFQSIGNGVGQIRVTPSQIFYEGILIGTYSGTATLSVSFNEHASHAAVQKLLNSLTFRSTSRTPSTASRTITVSLTDGMGGTSALKSKSINVTAAP